MRGPAASDERQAIEVVQSNYVGVVCIDAQSAVNCGPGIEVFIKCLEPHVPIVLIAAAGRIPVHFEKNVDIVIDRADFDITGGHLVREPYRDQVPFFWRWFDEWASRRTSQARGR